MAWVGTLIIDYGRSLDRWLSALSRMNENWYPVGIPISLFLHTFLLVLEISDYHGVDRTIEIILIGVL